MRQVAVLPTWNWREQRGVSTSCLQLELPLQYSFQTATEVSLGGSENADHRPNTSMTFGMLPVRLARKCLKQARSLDVE